MMVASLPRILRCRRVPKIAAILSAVSQQDEFAAALEQLVDGEVALEDEVAAVLDLRDGIEARQVDLLSLLGGELRAQQEGRVVEPFADDWRTQSVGSGLQRSDIVDRQECIVVLAEADLCAVELLLDEAVTIEVVSRLEGEERGHPHHHGAENFIADVEVIVGEAAALVGEDAIVRVRRRIFRHTDAEGCPLLHALEDEVDTVPVGSDHAAQPPQNIVFLADALFGPLDRDTMVAGEGFDPVLVVAVRSLKISLLTTGTPTIRRKKCTTCSGRDRPLR